ncbi:erythropoietin receptor isoform X2 [Strix uralensis]|uniref:erythropoietin receptor isoform X2 n=1 Tax=Strix uralensis TaxID=36305 RepID=UPI003DA6DC9B
MAASRCPPRAARSRGASQGAASPPGRGPRAQHWWLQQDLTAGALRGGLGRLWLRVEEAERLTGLYRRLGAHLEEEAGAARARLERLEAELSRRRRRLRDLRDRRDAATRPGRERPDPPQETPEPEEAEEGPEGAPPRAPPPPTPPRPPPSSTSPQRAARRAVGLELAALARGQALALGELRAEAAALGERLQRLRYGGEGQRAGARRAEELRQRLAQERRRRAGARRDLAEVRRDLGTATAALGHLAGRLRGLALEDGGAQPQPPPGDPQALSQLLAQTRAGLVALQGGLRGCPQTQRPPPNTLPQLRALMQRPDTEDPMAPPYSSDAGVLLAEEPLDPKCFSRRLHDLTCFWESDAPPDPRPFRLQYRLEQEPWQACELAAAPVTRNRSRFWCSLPPAAAVAFVPLELRVLPPPPGPPLHHRTLLLDQVVLLGPPQNVSVGPGGARGQLCVRWQPPPSPYLESSLAYELALQAPGLPPRTVGVSAGRREQRVGALRGSTSYSVRARTRPDGLSYGGYWSPWSPPATAVTPPDMDPMTLGLSCLLALLLLSLGLLGLLGHRRLLKEKLWPPVPGPEREFEGLFSAYGGNFQLWLCQGVGAPWAPPGGGPEAEELPSAVEEVGPPPGKGPPLEVLPPAAAPPAGPSPASSFEYTLFDPGSALLCPRGPPRDLPALGDPPGSPPPRGPYANLVPQKGAPPNILKWAPPDGGTPTDRDTSRLGPPTPSPPTPSPPYVLCS